MIKKLYLCHEPFTLENGLLTPTLKIKRHDMRLKYLDIITKLYSLPLVEVREESKKK